MFNCTTFHSYIYAVLAGLICTTNKWANYHPWHPCTEWPFMCWCAVKKLLTHHPWQFSKSFHC